MKPIPPSPRAQCLLRRSWRPSLNTEAGGFVRAAPYLLLFVPLIAGCLSSRDEVARVSSPRGDLDAVVMETNGGATTSFGYEVVVVGRGRSAFWGTTVARLYGAIRNQSAYGVNAKWRGAGLLYIEYLEARSAEVEGGALFDMGTTLVAVILAPGLNDPTACPGGMLYGLQMSNLRGPDCKPIHQPSGR